MIQASAIFPCTKPSRRKETPNPGNIGKTFLGPKSTKQQFEWTPNEFGYWKTGASADPAQSDGDMVLFDPKTYEPILPDFHGCGLMVKRQVLRDYLNAHYSAYPVSSVFLALTLAPEFNAVALAMSGQARNSPWLAMRTKLSDFFPQRFMPTIEGFVLDQPRNLQPEWLEHILSILWDNQASYRETGDTKYRFRFKGVLMTSSKVLQPPIYDQEWMRNFAAEINKFYGADNIKPLRSGARGKSKAPTAPPEAAPAARVPIQIDTGAETGNEDQDQDLDGYEVFDDDNAIAGASLHQVSTPTAKVCMVCRKELFLVLIHLIQSASHRAEVGSPTPRASTTAAARGSAPRVSSTLARGAVTFPTSLKSPTPSPPPSPTTSLDDGHVEDEFRDLFQQQTSKKVVKVTGEDPPSCTKGDSTARVEYLRLLWSDESYQELIDVYAKHMVSASGW